MQAVRSAACPASFAAKRHRRGGTGNAALCPSFPAQCGVAAVRKRGRKLDIEVARLGHDCGIAYGFGVFAPQKSLARENKMHDRRCRSLVARHHLTNVVHLLFRKVDGVPKMREAIAPVAHFLEFARKIARVEAFESRENRLVKAVEKDA